MARHEKLDLVPGPWDLPGDSSFSKVDTPRLIPPLVLARRMELHHSAFSDEVLFSMGKSEWYYIENGHYILEVRNKAFRKKLSGAADFVDFDDLLMSATRWHQKEWELLQENEPLRKRGVAIDTGLAKEAYQQSKIKIPGIVNDEARYTPRLNLFMLSVLARKMEGGMSKEEAWNEAMQEKEKMLLQIRNEGESVLSRESVDQDVMDIFAKNSPRQFVYPHVLPLIFANEMTINDLKIIVTRGKIDGPLGQMHKLHASGVMEQNVDMVLYSNDIKARAILFFSRLLPQLKNMCIRVFDDNPSEILPYRELAKQRGIGNLKLIHVRHPDAKRKDTPIDAEQPDQRYVDQESGTIFDHYLPLQKLFKVY